MQRLSRSAKAIIANCCALAATRWARRCPTKPTSSSPCPVGREGGERLVDLPNRICEQRTVRGEQAYNYGLKSRAQHHHCLGYGPYSVDLDGLEALRKEYSRRVRPITSLPIYVK